MISLPEGSTWTSLAQLPPLQLVLPLTEKMKAKGQCINPFIVNDSIGSLERLWQPVDINTITRKIREVVPPSRDITAVMLMELLTRGIKLQKLL
ncbi:hypothetical protein EIP86_004634, partial [Pleurotus ostreatoroseus]